MRQNYVIIEWRPVVGYEGKYEVSNDGRIRRVGYATSMCTFPLSKRGYPGVELYNGTGRGHNRTVHTLMLEAFIGPCPEGMIGLHADDVPDHNVLANLRWGTYSENIDDCINAGNGVQYVGKLSDMHVKYVRASPRLARLLAIELGVSKSLIYKIRSGKKRKRVK
jgi:hypothetical protein